MRLSEPVCVHLFAQGGLHRSLFTFLCRCARPTHVPPPVQNPENVNVIILWFEGRYEGLGETLSLIQEWNMMQGRASAAILRTTSLEARTRAPTIPNRCIKGS